MFCLIVLFRNLSENVSDFIKLRETTEQVFISDSMEQTIEIFDKFSGPFNFRQEETMVKYKNYHGFLLFYSLKDFYALNLEGIQF